MGWSSPPQRTIRGDRDTQCALDEQLRFPVGLLLFVLVALTTRFSRAAAQAPSAPNAVGSPPVDPGIGISALVLGLVLILALVIGVKAIDQRKAREREAVSLQTQLSDALEQDAGLAALPITVTAHVPYWHHSLATVELRGEVPGPEPRDAAIQLVRREMLRHHVSARIEGRIMVLPPVLNRAA